MTTSPPLKVFCSYSHRDEKALNQLRNHLAGLRRQGLIEDWHDRKIPPGGNWDDVIKHNLETADLILLLISSDFIQSDYCMDLETGRALERGKEGTATVIPVFLRECMVDGLSFTYLQGTPKDMRWINQQKFPDKAWAEVVATIHRAANLRLKPSPIKEKPQIVMAGFNSAVVSSDVEAPSAKPFFDKKIKRSVAALLVIVSFYAAWYFWQQHVMQQEFQASEILLQQGEYKQAKALCEAAAESSARDRCLRISGLMLEPSQLDQFHAQIESEPEKAYALTVMGENAAYQEDFASAENHYHEAIKLNPDIAQAYYGLGQILQIQQKNIDALPWYVQALDRAPNNRRYLHDMAAVHAELGQLEQAEAKYRDLLKQDESQLLAYAELIEVLLQQGKTADAKVLVEQVRLKMRQNPDWKNHELNAQEWYVIQNGEPAYLSEWPLKKAYLESVFQQTD